MTEFGAALGMLVLGIVGLLACVAVVILTVQAAVEFLEKE